MMQIPQRSSLVAQVAEILRQGIHNGEWKERLPSELALCDRLQVSRRTLRAALAVLEREGLFRVRYAKGREICAPIRRRAATRTSNVIGVWYEQPTPIVSPAGDSFLNALKGQLNAAGYEMVVVHAQSRSKGMQTLNSSKTLIQQHRAACWILRSAPVELQRWFIEQHIPVILAGTTQPGIHLPSFDTDFRAVCRHAAQTFLHLGHHQVAFVTPRTEFEGDLASARGFSEAFENRTGTSGWVIHHDGTVRGVCKVLDELMRSADPPSAILVSRSIHTVTALSHLLKSGKAIPGQVSLISRDDDEFLGAVTPSIARYVLDRSMYTKRFARAVLKLAKAGSITPRQCMFFPQLFRGETLAAPRSIRA